MSQLHNFVIKSATGLILGKEQISVVPAKGCRKNLKRHPDPKVKLNGKGQPTMADVLASISERQAANNRKGGTR